jgi:hypothetical protein
MLLWMYIPRNWEFGSALSEFRGGGVWTPPNPSSSVHHCPHYHENINSQSNVFYLWWCFLESSAWLRLFGESDILCSVSVILEIFEKCLHTWGPWSASDTQGIRLCPAVSLETMCVILVCVPQLDHILVCVPQLDHILVCVPQLDHILVCVPQLDHILVCVPQLDHILVCVPQLDHILVSDMKEWNTELHFDPLLLFSELFIHSG